MSKREKRSHDSELATDPASEDAWVVLKNPNDKFVNGCRILGGWLTEIADSAHDPDRNVFVNAGRPVITAIQATASEAKTLNLQADVTPLLSVLRFDHAERKNLGLRPLKGGEGAVAALNAASACLRALILEAQAAGNRQQPMAATGCTSENAFYLLDGKWRTSFAGKQDEMVTTHSKGMKLINDVLSHGTLVEPSPLPEVALPVADFKLVRAAKAELEKFETQLESATGEEAEDLKEKIEKRQDWLKKNTTDGSRPRTRGGSSGKWVKAAKKAIDEAIEHLKDRTLADHLASNIRRKNGTIVYTDRGLAWKIQPDRA